MENAKGRYATIGSNGAAHQILYINPNSTVDMTEGAARYFEHGLAPDISIGFYTAPSPARRLSMAR